MKKHFFTLLKTILPLGLGIYLFWYFFSSMSQEHITSFYKALHEANYFWVFVAMLLEFISLWSRAYRWKYMLEPLGHQSSWSNRYHAMMIGYLANYTLPRAGEPVRSAMLYRSDGIPFAQSLGTIIVERGVDVIMLLLVVLITILVGHTDLMHVFSTIPAELSQTYYDPTDISQTNQTLTSFLLISTLIIGVVLLFGVKKIRNKVISFLRGLLDGILAIFKTPHPFAFIGHTFLIWLCWILMFIVPFYSLPETSNIPLSGMMFGFILGTLGMSFTNGGIGVYPLLVGFSVAIYLHPDYGDKATGIGNALGMIIWIGNTAIMIILGLISLALLPRNYTKKSHTQ